MIKKVEEYLEKNHRGNKLISIKDEINEIFKDDKDNSFYYGKIMGLIRKSIFRTEKIFSVVHIRQSNFNKILKELNK